jgi:hypothetical protein
MTRVNSGSVKERLFRSLRIGTSLTTISVAIVIVADLLLPTAELPFLQRNPFAWLYYWPTLLWNSPAQTRAGNLNTIVSLILNLVAYSAIAYAFLTYRQVGQVRDRG